MFASNFWIAVVASLLTVGCAKKLAAKTPTVPATTARAAAATVAPPPIEPAPVSPHVGASDELIAQCNLRFANATEAPKFQLDETSLLPADRNALDQVAVCLTSGPLKGRAVKLVGRADPRGTEEYNLGLGVRRAGTVSNYLKRLGVSSRQLSETTRGAIDAKGIDESSWHLDRRVDLELVN